MFSVTINKQEFEFPEGISVLDALQQISVEVPSLCHDPRLKPIGACRLCVVEVRGWQQSVAACSTLLAEGMEIETHTPELEQSRKASLRLLAQKYPAAPFLQFPEKEFHQQIRAYGLDGELFATPDGKRMDLSHPYLHVNMSQCISCFRCVRICEELQGQFVWKVQNRGDETQIVPDSGTNLLESSCVSCGACVDTCPTGALEDKTVFSLGAVQRWTKTTCPYCGTGCEMMAGSRNDRLVAVKPALDGRVSKGHLCVKGRYAFDFVHAEDRITQPMIRRRSQWETVSWEEALSFTACEFRRIGEQYGPQGMGVLGSARATNEENYLAQKFARLVLGTNNVDCCARVCHAPTAQAMNHMLGTGAATNSFDDIEKTRTLLIAGANVTENHPVVGARIKQAALQGAILIVIDPRAIELARYASCHLALRPGTNVPLLNAMACTIVQEKLYDEAAVQERVADWEEFRKFILSWTPEKIADICGVEPELIRRAARLYATGKPSICFHGLGLTEHTQGTEGVMCLVNLVLLTGNFGKPGTGINPLRGQNNVQGAALMGCEPDHLTGYVPLEDGRASFETAWNAKLPENQGLNLMQMLDATPEGKLKGLWVIGYDIALTNPNAEITRQALRSLEFTVVQDLFLNETAREFASVFLPAASSFEKDGTFMNAERRIQPVKKVIEPIGASKADWEIICELARAMGKGEHFNFHAPKEIWEEVRRIWKAGYGITYDRLEQGGLQWPCWTEEHPGTQRLHHGAFPHRKRAQLCRVDYTPTAEITSDEFPYLLNTGRTLYQFNSGTMTQRTKNAELRPTDTLEISPEDAAKHLLQNGERVRIQSRYGAAMLPVRITPGIKRGELFATFHSPATFLNRVTGSYRDRYTGTPEYKVTAVRVKKIAGGK